MKQAIIFNIFCFFWAPIGDWMDTKPPYVMLLGFTQYIELCRSFYIFIRFMWKIPPICFFFLLSGTRTEKEKYTR